MMLTARNFSRTQPLQQRRNTAYVLLVSTLLLQLTLPSLDSERWVGVLPLLLLPVTAYCLHGLTSNAWVWNRLFRKEAELDEYERHTRNAFIARAYQMVNGWVGLTLFLAYLYGGGFLANRLPYPVFLPGANGEIAGVLLFLVVVLAFQYLPRIIAAVSEDDPEE